MTPKEIREHLKAQPFQPIRLYVSNGAAYVIADRANAYVTVSQVKVATEFGEEGVPTRSIHLDPRHITRIEPVNGARKSR